MVCWCYIFVSLILSSSSLEYGAKEYLVDEKGFQGISSSWDTECANTWSLTRNGIFTCFPKAPEEANCTAISSLYNVKEAKELFANIQTETRDCKKVENAENCTGKLSLLVHYWISENNSKRVTLPDEIPKNSPSIGETEKFYNTNDNIHFSVDQIYKSLKLEFQAPFYCGNVKNVSLYYYLCPTNTGALVDFPEVPAPSKLLSPSISVGTCTKNAVKKSSSHHLSMKCYYNGTAEVSGDCECQAGYQRNKNICEG